jgi:uncharacterized membrane protein YidH (DUF202 family)
MTLVFDVTCRQLAKCNTYAWNRTLVNVISALFSVRLVKLYQHHEVGHYSTQNLKQSLFIIIIIIIIIHSVS